MARIIPFSDDPHEQTRALLPWYVNGTLDDAEAAGVDAHLAECQRCRAELEAERALRHDIASTALDPDRGWDKVCDSISIGNRDPRRSGFLRRRIALGWAVSAQLAIAALLVVSFTLASSPSPEPRYSALGSPQRTISAKAIILFRPDADMAEVRAALTSVGARIVDGPTTSGAYLLELAPERRLLAFEILRGRPSVTLVEPLDAAQAR